MLVNILGVLLFALCVCLSLALHEAGHLLTAKAFGMKVRRYFVGIGPRVFSFRRGETEYGVKALPFGGFCDIAGMTNLDELTPDEERRAMFRQQTWKRTTVMAAGPVTHFLLGFVLLYALAATAGLPNLTQRPVISESSGAAEAAGIRSSDEIVGVGGIPTPTWQEMVAAVRGSAGPTVFEIRRGERRLSLTVDVPRVERPVTSADGTTELAEVGVAGVTRAESLDYGPLAAIPATVSFSGDMFGQTFQRLITLPERMPAVVASIFGAERDPDTPVSVVGASRIGGELAEAGLWSLFLLLLAGLNFFLGVFNLLPLLPLDGGHITVWWYEHVRNRVRGRRGKTAAAPVDYTRLSTVTMALVLVGGLVMLLTVTADIVNPVRLL